MPASRRGQNEQFSQHQAILIDGGSTKAKAQAVTYFREVFAQSPEPPAGFDSRLLDALVRIVTNKNGAMETRIGSVDVIVALLGNPNNSRVVRGWIVLCTQLTHTIIRKGVIDVFEKCIETEPTALRERCVDAVLFLLEEGCGANCKYVVYGLVKSLAEKVSRGSITSLSKTRDVLTICRKADDVGRSGTYSYTVAHCVRDAGAVAFRRYPADPTIVQAYLPILADHSEWVDDVVREAGTIKRLIGVIESGETKSQELALRVFVNFLTVRSYAPRRTRTIQSNLLLSKAGFFNGVIACTESNMAAVKAEAIKVLRYLDPDLSNDASIAAVLRLTHDQSLCQDVHDELFELVWGAMESSVRLAARDRLINLLSLGLLRYVVEQLCLLNFRPNDLREITQCIRTLLGLHPQFWRVITQVTEKYNAEGRLGLVPPARVRRAADYVMEEGVDDL